MTALRPPVAEPRLEYVAQPDGVRLAVERHPGATDSIVLFGHGFGQTRQAWGGSARAVAERGHTALAFDLRGHGDSGWNAPDHAYVMELFLADLQRLARAQPAKPVMVGASMGGLLGMMAEANSDESLFSALVLVDITPRWETAGVERILAFMSAHPDGFATYDEAADAIAAYLPHRTSRKSPEQLRQLLVRRDDGRLRWHWDPRMLDPIGRDGDRYQSILVDSVHRIRIPTLLISGGRSDLVTDTQVEEFQRLVPHAQHVRIADATHMVAGDRNDVFTDAILAFLSTAAPAAASPGATP